MGNTIVSFEDFQKKFKKGLREDTLIPTGASTVFTGDQENQEGHHSEEKNYMFFKNLYTMKKCIEEIMSMDKEQVDELIEKGHDWASDHISSSKDDLQEVCDWLRYEIENYEGDEGGDEDDEESGIVIIGSDDEDDDDDDDEDDEDEDDEDEDDDVELSDEEEEEDLESPKYSYTEEKN